MFIQSDAGIWVNNDRSMPLTNNSINVPAPKINKMDAGISSSHVSTFLQKLLAMIEDPTCDHLIAWCPYGDSFRVHDPVNFSKDVLPQYFKHSNFSSFVRQLNMYDFHKVLDVQQGALDNGPQDWEFANTKFKRGQLSLLTQVKRKVGSVDNNRPKNETLKRVMLDIESLSERQRHAQEKIEHLHTDNKAVWGEMSKLNSRHQLQQHTINRILYFLTSIYAPDRFEDESAVKITTEDGRCEAGKINNELYHASLGAIQDPAYFLASPTFHQATEAETNGFFNSLGDLISNNQGNPGGNESPHPVTSSPTINIGHVDGFLNTCNPQSTWNNQVGPRSNDDNAQSYMRSF